MGLLWAWLKLHPLVLGVLIGIVIVAGFAAATWIAGFAIATWIW